MPRLGGSRIGPYEIVAPLGAGGMGEVYRARDTRLRREVAIKILPEVFALDADRRVRFEREAQVLATLNHPNIAAIYGLEEAGSSAAIVMELVEGPTLADLIASGPQPLPEALNIARQIALALEAAHDKNVIHRDLKPANVKRTFDGTVKVLDFGLAKALASDASGTDFTQSPTISFAGTRAGLILGTAAYMSPEQARGQTVDQRADIWAFGCVLYELLTGSPAFPGSSASDIIASILTREPEWSRLPRDTPESVRRALRRCLERDIRCRLRHVADVRLELDDVAQAPVTHGPEAHKRDGQGSRWRSRLLVALASSALTSAVLYLASAQRGIDPAAATAGTFVSLLTDHGGSERDTAIAPDGRSFVFVSAHDGTPDLWMRQVSGGNPVRLTADGAEEAHPSFARDGDTVYFTRIENGVPSVWRVAALGGPARKVVERARMPVLSPDGKSMAYLTWPPPSDLVVAALDGSAARVLQRQVPAGVGTERPQWSPDGRWLSYNRWQLFGASNLWLVDTISGEARQTTAFKTSSEGIGSHVWLPDSRRVVLSYQQSWEGLAGYGTLGVLDTTTGSIVRLTIRVMQALESLSLSADGSRLIATVSEARNEVWKVPLTADPAASGRGAVRLVDSTYGASWTFVSRDGGTLLFSGRGRDLWTMPLDRPAKPTPITALGQRGAFHSSLSPDGTLVAFVSSGGGPANIWLQHVDGSGLRQVTREDTPDTWPVWTPDGQWIVFGSWRGGSPGMWRIRPHGGEPERIGDGFFRGDLFDRPDGGGTLLVTTSQAEDQGLRLIDLSTGAVLWRQQFPGTSFALPVFSADGRMISLPVQEHRDRYAIWVLDTATGSARMAVRFDEPFDMVFRASWVDAGKAFVVNRRTETSHAVLFDRFWIP
jgi:serine/threonine protein kinase/Tol biopolymer transport system component